MYGHFLCVPFFWRSSSQIPGNQSEFFLWMDAELEQKVISAWVRNWLCHWHVLLGNQRAMVMTFAHSFHIFLKTFGKMGRGGNLFHFWLMESNSSGRSLLFAEKNSEGGAFLLLAKKVDLGTPPPEICEVLEHLAIQTSFYLIWQNPRGHCPSLSDVLP